MGFKKYLKRLRETADAEQRQREILDLPCVKIARERYDAGCASYEDKVVLYEAGLLREAIGDVGEGGGREMRFRT